MSEEVDDIVLVGVVADHGTIVEFEGEDEDGARVHVMVDHSVAQVLVDIIEEDGSVLVGAESWQVLRA